MKTILVVFVCLCLCACVTAPDAANPLSATSATSRDAVLAKTKLMPDPHSGWTRVVGPLVFQDGIIGGRRYSIQGWNDPARPDLDNTFELQASAGFPKRVYLKQAYANGRELETKLIDRERIDCGYDCTTIETIGIALSATDMARYATDGLSFEVIGRRETVRFAVPAPYFAAVLEFQQRYRRGSL